jgi:hypothetical protein
MKRSRRPLPAGAASTAFVSEIIRKSDISGQKDFRAVAAV